MAKKKKGSNGDDITFNMVDKNTVKRLQKAGKVKVPKKKVKIPKDKKWNEKQMGSKLLQGIMNGDSIGTISKSFTEVVNNNAVSAVRNARTMTTSAECNGRIDSYKDLEDKGTVLKKVWIATPDDRTRESHLEIDGEEVDVDDEFSNGCKFPGDGNGPPEEVWNCRCSIRSHIIGFMRDDGTISYIEGDRGETMHDRQMEKEKERRKKGA